MRRCDQPRTLPPTPNVEPPMRPPKPSVCVGGWMTGDGAEARIAVGCAGCCVTGRGACVAVTGAAFAAAGADVLFAPVAVFDAGEAFARACVTVPLREIDPMVERT